MHHYFLFGVIALFDSQFHRATRLLSFIVDDSAYTLLANSTPDFLKTFTKRLQKSQKYFYLLSNSKEASRTVNYCTRQYKGRRGIKASDDRQSRATYSISRKPPDSANNRGFSVFSEADHPSKERLNKFLFRLVNRAYPTMYASI